MSQYTFEPMPVEQNNGLAIAGFACAIVGLFTGGLLSPIALILSLVALGRPGGRGFAIAGVIIGLLGSCGAVVVLLVVILAGVGAVLAAVGLGFAMIALGEPEKIELTSDMINIVIAAKMYEKEQGVLPAELSLLDIRESVLSDPWGNPYEYHFIDDAPGFDIISWGEDGESGTEDDVYLTKLDETWEATGNIVFNYEEKDDSGTITFQIGDRTITVHGDKKGGRITIDLGDRIIEVTGDEEGGHINVSVPEDAPPETDPETTPETDSAETPVDATPPETTPDESPAEGSDTEVEADPGI